MKSILPLKFQNVEILGKQSIWISRMVRDKILAQMQVISLIDKFNHVFNFVKFFTLLNIGKIYKRVPLNIC